MEIYRNLLNGRMRRMRACPRRLRARRWVRSRRRRRRRRGLLSQPAPSRGSAASRERGTGHPSRRLLRCMCRPDVLRRVRTVQSAICTLQCANAQVANENQRTGELVLYTHHSLNTDQSTEITIHVRGEDLRFVWV